MVRAHGSGLNSVDLIFGGFYKYPKFKCVEPPALVQIGEIYNSLSFKCIEPTALSLLIVFNQRVKTRCYKMVRASGSGLNSVDLMLGGFYRIPWFKWSEPPALSLLISFNQRVKTRCYRIVRAYGSALNWVDFINVAEPSARYTL